MEIISSEKSRLRRKSVDKYNANKAVCGMRIVVQVVGNTELVIPYWPGLGKQRVRGSNPLPVTPCLSKVFS